MAEERPYIRQILLNSKTDGDANNISGQAQIPEDATENFAEVSQPISQVDQSSHNYGDGLSMYGQAQIYGDVNDNRTAILQSPAEQQPTGRSTWSSLIALYQSEASWFHPIPGDNTIKFEPENFYAPMSMDVLKRDGDERFVEYEFCQLFKLFDSPVGEETPRRVLIRAGEGFGKTTLCTKLAFDWASKVETFKQFPCESTLVLKYCLSEFKVGQNLEEELVKFLHYHSQHQATSELSVTRNIIHEYKNRLLLVMDGLDELLPSIKDQVQNILQLNYRSHQSDFRLATIIVTSRFYQMESSLFGLFNKHIRITGLNEEHRTDLIEKFFKSEQHNKLKLKCKDVIAKEKSSPLYIVLTCWCLSQKMEGQKQNQKDLFINCARLMGRRCNVRNGPKFEEPRIEDLLTNLGKMFLTLQSYQVSIDIDAAKEVLGELYELATTSGILVSVPKEEKEKTEKVKAVNKDFQESLVAYHEEKTWSGFTEHHEKQMYIVENHSLDYVNIHTESQIIIFGSEKKNLHYTFEYEIGNQNFSLHVCSKKDRDNCPQCAPNKMEPLMDVKLFSKIENKWELVFPIIVSICTEFPGNANYIADLHKCENVLNFENNMGRTNIALRIFDGREDAQKVLCIPRNTARPRFGVKFSRSPDESEDVSHTSIERSSVFVTENYREAQFASRHRNIEFLLYERKTLTASDLNQYLSGVTILITDEFPEISNAQSLKDCFLLWASFFSGLFQRQAYHGFFVRVGNNQGDIIFKIYQRDCVIRDYRVDWSDCTMLEFRYLPTSDAFWFL